MSDKELFTTEDFEVWKETAESRGHKVEMHERESEPTEWTVDKIDEDDTTIIGYFSEDWGMLL